MPKRGKSFYHFYLGRAPKHWVGAIFAFLAIASLTFGLLFIGRLQGVDLARLLNGLAVSFWRIIFAYLIALFLAVIIALLVTRSERVENLLLPVFETAQSLPTVAILPLVILWLGSSTAVVFLLVATIVWPITFSIISGIKGISRPLREAATIFGAKGWKGFWNFSLPLLLPSAITGSIIGWGEGWEVLVAAELIGGEQGIGAYIGEVSERGELVIMTVAITFLMFVIFILNKWVWVPLLKRATLHQI